MPVAPVAQRDEVQHLAGDPPLERRAVVVGGAQHRLDALVVGVVADPLGADLHVAAQVQLVAVPHEAAAGARRCRGGRSREAMKPKSSPMLAVSHR